MADRQRRNFFRLSPLRHRADLAGGRIEATGGERTADASSALLPCSHRPSTADTRTVSLQIGLADESSGA